MSYAIHTITPIKNTNAEITNQIMLKVLKIIDAAVDRRINPDYCYSSGHCT